MFELVSLIPRFRLIAFAALVALVVLAALIGIGDPTL
jgi:hypothetical protein